MPHKNQAGVTLTRTVNIRSKYRPSAQRTNELYCWIDGAHGVAMALRAVDTQGWERALRCSWKYDALDASAAYLYHHTVRA